VGEQVVQVVLAPASPPPTSRSVAPMALAGGGSNTRDQVADLLAPRCCARDDIVRAEPPGAGVPVEVDELLTSAERAPTEAVVTLASR